MAGLNVLQLINEPTAAALSYGRNQKDDKKLLVYDLGGGTFDVSIMEFTNHVANTLSTRGDHHLGGADWDRAIVDYVLDQVGGKWDKLDKATQGMLMNAAEEAKKNLTDEDECVITFNYKGIQQVRVSREEFENRTRMLMQKTKLLVEEALDAANLHSYDIDEVILVGGSSRMAMVMDLAQSLFPDSEVKLVDPDRAVAKGAALTAAQDDKGYVAGGLTLGKDKGSRAYGIRVIDFDTNKLYVANLIKLNDDLEYTNTFNEFCTADNNQTLLEMHFYESECEYDRMDVDPSLEIPALGGDQNVNWGKPVPKGTPISIKVSRDKSGQVKMFIACSGAEREFIMDTARKGQVARR